MTVNLSSVFNRNWKIGTLRQWFHIVETPNLTKVHMCRPETRLDSGFSSIKWPPRKRAVISSNVTSTATKIGYTECRTGYFKIVSCWAIAWSPVELTACFTTKNPLLGSPKAGAREIIKLAATTLGTCLGANGWERAGFLDKQAGFDIQWHSGSINPIWLVIDKITNAKSWMASFNIYSSGVCTYNVVRYPHPAHWCFVRSATGATSCRTAMIL